MLKQSPDKRVVFDFEIDFLNGVSLQGQGFRLDIDGEEIADRYLGDELVRDLRLWMVEEVRILNKRIIEERHKGAVARSADANSLLVPTHVDLSHTVHDGLITYKGIPAPLICDFLSREESRKFYDADTSFQIGRIDMVTNTGTYLDSPFHRFEDGKDLSQLELAMLVGLDAVVARVTGSTNQAVDREVFRPLDVRQGSAGERWMVAPLGHGAILRGAYLPHARCGRISARCGCGAGWDRLLQHRRHYRWRAPRPHNPAGSRDSDRGTYV